MPDSSAQLNAVVLEKYTAQAFSAGEYPGGQGDENKGKMATQLRRIEKRRNNERLTGQELEDERQTILEASASVIINKTLRKEYDSRWMNVLFSGDSANTRGAVADECGWKT